MINFTRKHSLLFLLCLLCIFSKVNGQQNLYAINGASGGNSILYRLDATTGAVIATVGPTGFTNVTALAISPVTGHIYGFSNPTFGAGSLIKIDPSTGQGTLVGSPNLQVPDMTFNSAGVLYAWAEQGDSDDLYIIDINTGSATKVGECDCNTTGTGLAFRPSGELFMKTKDGISQINPNTGLILSTVKLSSLTHNLLAFSATNQGYTGIREAGKFTLQKIDPYTGVVTNVGVNSIGLISAIVFGAPLAPSLWYLDADGDNYAVSTISSDGNPGTGYTKTVLPVTDCDDSDATLNPLTVWYLDADGDNYAISTTQSCTNPGTGYTRTALPLTDCNDADAAVNPLTLWYLDFDGDGYAISTTQSCNKPATGYTRTILPLTDCNDSDASLNPTTIWYLDFDGDNYAVSTTQSCIQPATGYTRTVLPLGDCNDADAGLKPTTEWYLDFDGDNFAISSMQSCTKPGTGYTRTELPVTDCNDADATLKPTTVWYRDADGDLFAMSTLRSCTNPGTGYTRTVLPIIDCDDSKILYTDNDLDGFGTGSPIPCGGVTNKLDCDDTKFLYADADADGFGSGAPVACGVANNTDNCPAVANATQKDHDQNGIGDVCDAKLDVCQAMENLMTSVNNYIDKTKDEDKLNDKLEKSLDNIDKNKIKQAIDDLEWFIKKVGDKIGKKDGLTAAEAADLIAQANVIIDALENDTYSVPCGTPPRQIDMGSEWPLFVAQGVPNAAVQVFPNPSNGQFAIKINSFNDSKANILILDAKGSVVERKHLQSTSGQTVHFNLSNRIGGLYIVKVISNDGVQTAKIIVNK